VNLTPNGGRVLLGVGTAFGAMTGAVLGVSAQGFLGTGWVGLGFLVALTATGAMVAAGYVEYLRRAPHLSRVMAAAGLAGLLFPLAVFAIVPLSFAFPVLCLLVGAATVWVDVRTSQRTGWDG
jgi:hypothetical protein